MKRRWKILIAAFVVAMLVSIARHYQLRWATQSYIAQLKAQGEPMDLAQVTPPPVPAEQNGADIVKKADGMMDFSDRDQTNEPNSMFMVAPGKAVVVFRQPDLRDSYSTNSWANVMAAMETNLTGKRELLRQVVNYPSFDFHLDYGPDIGMQFTNLWLVAARTNFSAEAICGGFAPRGYSNSHNEYLRYSRTHQK